MNNLFRNDFNSNHSSFSDPHSASNSSSNSPNRSNSSNTNNISNNNSNSNNSYSNTNNTNDTNNNNNNSNSNNNSSNSDDSNTNANNPRPDYVTQQQSYQFQSLNYPQHQIYSPYSNQHQYQLQQQPQQPHFQLSPHQQQQQHSQFGHSSPDNYQQSDSDSYSNYDSYPARSLQHEYSSQDGGPTRSHRRGLSSESSHSVRFNPSRNYNVDSSDQGTFVSRPRIVGLPCIACSMSRAPCDGGSPCRTCLLNRLRCHYEGENNTRFFGIDELQLGHPFSTQQPEQQQSDNHDNPLNQLGQVNFTSPRSRSRSDSSSASISGSGSGSSIVNNSSHDQSHTRVSPLVTPITLSDQSLISIPPFQEISQIDRLQHNKVTLPSISILGSSMTPLSSFPSHNSRSTSLSKVSAATSLPRALQSNSEGGNTQNGASSSKPNSERPILPSQRLSATRSPQVEKSRSMRLNSATDPDAMMKRQFSKKQQQQQPTPNQKDPLYSLSSASIRARKNALEMENIQRASHLYADYIAKIKDLSVSVAIESEIVNKITTTFLSESEVSPLNKMDVDSERHATSDRATSVESSSLATVDVGVGDPSSDKECGPTESSDRVNPEILTSSENEFSPIQGLESMARSGLLHGLIQQYFILIHPQFMILHKNQFLVRFWEQYGPFPEARELQIELLRRSRPDNIRQDSIESTLNSSAHGEQGSTFMSPSSPLLVMAMLALVSRHINDRGPLKSTAQDKQRRLEKSLVIVNAEFQSGEFLEMCQEKCQEKVQEARLHELMETDDQGQSETGEDLKDRGEQYFQWATELLKAEYEQPSLTVVQSLLLLREYAIMAGNHTQAYMYGGTAITMAMGLGWHHAHLASKQEDKPSNETQAGSPAEVKAEQERQTESKANDEEQKLCWWQCFIVDRWMSAAYNRPVNIPVHIFDKTHLRPLPKPKKSIQSKEKLSSLTPEFWLSSGAPEASVLTKSMMQSGDVNMLSIGSGVSPSSSSSSSSLPSAHFRTKSFFDQQCRQALLLDDILCFLSSWSDDLFVNSTEFEKLSGALDDWHRSLSDWQTFPLSGIMNSKPSHSITKGQEANISSGKKHQGILSTPNSNTGADEERDVVQSALLGISFHTIRILLYRPFLRTNMRHPPCLPARASTVCAQSANAMTSLAEFLMNQADQSIQQCLLMRHQFALVTAAGIQLMNANLEDEPRLSTPAKINLLKTIRILRDADRSSWGVGVKDGFLQVLRELFPAQMKLMYDGQ